MKEDKKKAIREQISKLEKELEALNLEEITLGFITTLRNVLLIDKCSIILQGHEEYQFSEKYNMSNIPYDVRKEIVKLLNKIEAKRVLDKTDAKEEDE